MVTTTDRGLVFLLASGNLWEYENVDLCLLSNKTRRNFNFMKNYILGVITIMAVSLSTLSGQAAASTTSAHTVLVGDTLWDIAQDNHISVEDLLDWNQLDSSLIFPEQELKIQGNVETYIVQKGDTLSEIAANHSISLSELMQWNKISDHLIFPEERLIVEAGTRPTAQTKVQVKTNKVASESTVKAEPKTGSEQKAETTPVAQVPPASPSAGKEMSVTATAYTAYCAGCSGTTYTGIDLRANPNQKVIAVDPSIIPLGSRVWVEGYGEAIAGDIGGAIKGNIIDVFLESKQDALNWGRKTVTIKILN